MGAPQAVAPLRSHAAILPPRFSPSSPLAAARFGSFRLRQFPMRPMPAVFPILHRPVFFGRRFFIFGLGFNSFWWPGCGPYWGWGFTCNALPYYGYSFGNYYGSLYVPPVPSAPPTYEYPESYPYPWYPYGEERRDLVRLFLKDGTMYDVTDYWVVDDQMHFTTIEEGGTKSVEHIIGFDELDLQRTIDVNTRRGFRFVLRNAPLEQYLEERRGVAPPVSPAPPED